MAERLKPISSVARDLGIQKRYIQAYGDYKAKITIDILPSIRSRKRGKYIVVTGITPTPFGEGKTVTTVGLSMALNRLGKRAVCTIREPSLGPFFGIKGGGVGGGRSQALPGDDINLHLTGDMHAVGAAHNLCAAFLDNHLFRGNAFNVNINKIFWNRVLDVNDRALRNVKIGLGGGENSVERESRFDITAASEVMAILALAGSLKDLRSRLGRIVVGMTNDGTPVTAEDLKVAGAMAVLLVEAIRPNLVQTSEHTPCFVHTGPFANITHGNSSIIADEIGLRLADFVVTESGFGADCGIEKFVNIKCRTSGRRPAAAVLVASVRALKMHSGRYRVVAGRALDDSIYTENLGAVEAGCSNLRKQIENVLVYGIPCVVAVNRFTSDTPAELALVKNIALEAGATDCVTSDLYNRGSAGGVALAKAVINASKGGGRLKFLYPLDLSIKGKIEAIATRIYGARGVTYEQCAEENIALYERLGFGNFPVCMAKTHLSLSHDPHLKGAPKDFVLPIRDVRPSIGAGFLYVLCGTMLTMPGLSSHPVGERMDIDSKGRIRYVS